MPLKLKMSPEITASWKPAAASTVALIVGMSAGSWLGGQTNALLSGLSIAIPFGLLAFVISRTISRRDLSKVRQDCRRLEARHKQQIDALEQARTDLQIAEDTRRQADAKARHLLEHDNLTDLPNRRYLTRHIEGRIVMAQKGEATNLTVMMLDLDRFKEVNDTLGHPAGDELLKLAAKRLLANIPPTAMVARMGGDEFAVVATGFEGPSDAAIMAEEIVNAFRKPFHLARGHKVNTQASLGVSIFPDHGEDGDTLLSRADLALYEAKSFGRGRYSLYSKELHTTTEERRTLEADLAIAIEEQQFVLHFQPRFSLTSRKMIAIEALLRWNHPTRGQLQPADFISVSESTGQIDVINFWTIEQACIEARQWELAGYRLMVTVNLSPVQFRKPDIARRILQVLDRTELSPELLELEITESVCTRTLSGTIERELQRIKGMGVRLAIDDFGMGYSSLAYLKWLPFDTIKIDQSFIGAMNVDERDRAVVKTVITLAKSLKKIVVAEGVESDEQLDMLMALGCDEAQGYLLARPTPIAELQIQLDRFEAA